MVVHFIYTRFTGPTERWNSSKCRATRPCNSRIKNDNDRRLRSKNNLRQNLATAPVLARWLGVTDHTVREMAKAGIVVRVKRGLYRLEESVRRAFEHVRQTASAAWRRGKPRGDASRANPYCHGTGRRIGSEERGAKPATRSRPTLCNRGGRRSSADRVVRCWRCRHGVSNAYRTLPRHDISEIDLELRAALTEARRGQGMTIATIQHGALSAMGPAAAATALRVD